MSSSDNQAWDDDVKLGVVRKFLRESAADGISRQCPACTRRVGVARRARMNRRKLDALAKLYKTYGGTPFHLGDALRDLYRDDDVREPAEMSELRHIGLLHRVATDSELMTMESATERNSAKGWYYVTATAVEWMRGWILVPDGAWMFDGKFVGVNERQLHVNRVVNERFDLDAILAESGPAPSAQ